MTLDTAITLASYKLGESSAPTSGTEDYIKRTAWANEAQRIWTSRKDWNILKTTGTATTTNGQSYILLPTDYTQNTLSGKIKVNNVTYEVVNIEDKDRYATGVAVAWTSYDLATGRWRLYFSITPDGSYSVTFNYLSTPVDMSGSSTVIIPIEDWLVNYIVAKSLQAMLSGEEANYAQSYIAENENLMQQMLKDDRRGNRNNRGRLRTTLEVLGIGYGSPRQYSSDPINR